MPRGLTLCMIVKDEAANLARCLDSVQALTPDMVVVDTGSTDETLAIAARYGARVLSFDFGITDFSAARNHGLAEAKTPWILVLDADETLHPESPARIAALLAGPANTAYYLERYNQGPQSTRDYVVRLFPNCPKHRYRGRVHETLDASILAAGNRLHQTTIRIDHKFADDPAARRAKNLRYVEILKQELAADPRDYTRLEFLAAEYHQLEMFAEAAEAAEQVATLRPRDARAQLFAGVYHLLYQPDLPRARYRLGHALSLRPNYPEASEFLNLLALRSGASPAE